MGLIEMDKQEARMEGSEKQKRIFVENLLRSTDFSNEKIADLAGVTQDLVSEIKKNLSL